MLTCSLGCVGLLRWAVEQLLKEGKSVLLMAGSLTSLKDGAYLAGLAQRYPLGETTVCG